MIHIDIANEQDDVHVDESRIRAAVAAAMAHGGVADATISVAVVDDAAIHALNRRDLAHDYPTDVLSYRLDDGGPLVEGEIVASGATAARMAERFDGWSAGDELLLYLVHGALHLAGFDDQTAESRAEMRSAERHCLELLDLAPQYDDDAVLSPRAAEPAAGGGKGTAP